MKAKILITSVICILTFSMFSQGTWTQKANVGGTAKRFGGIGFSIGTKGYIGAGVTLLLNDFWEWDQTTNVWTQKANFTGGYRLLPVGFSIGTKGYLGLGSDGSNVYYKEFWEWDQASNTWTQKAPFPGPGREFAVGFSVGTKGYVGAGQDSLTDYQDFWEWDQTSNAWTAKTIAGGLTRSAAVGFAIGSLGYMGTGTIPNDFWEWNPTTSSWTQKAAIPGAGRMGAVGFSIGTKGYIGTGNDFGTGEDARDFWEWNQATNTWTQKANFGGTARSMAVGFSIGNKGYLGTGIDSVDFRDDFWEFDPNVGAVNEIDLSSQISVYPNPSIGKFTVTSGIETGAFSVHNADGKVVFTSSGEMRSFTIDLSTREAGIYFLYVKTDKGTAVKKLIIPD